MGSPQEGTHEQTRTILKAQKKCYELGSHIGVRVSGHFEVIVAPCWPQKKVMVETLYIKGNSIYIYIYIYREPRGKFLHKPSFYFISRFHFRFPSP